MTGRRWQAPLWAWALMLPLAALLASLGYWQLQRGDAKQQLIARYLAAGTQPPQPLDGQTPAPVAGAVQRALARGHYLPERELLLDNQSQARRPGMHVWTPMRLADGVLVMVDRGWVPMPESRQAPRIPPPPSGLQTVPGLWRPLPQPGLRLASDNCRGQGWPRIVQYPEADELRCLYGEAVLPGILLLDPGAPGGFVRSWSQRLSEVPPARHYGYAAQWFALCATLLVLFVVLNLKKIR